MKVAVYGRNFDQGFLGYIQAFFHYLNHYGFQIDIHRGFLSFMSDQYQFYPSVNSTFTGYKDIDENVDFLISIGGDGTFLDTVSLVRETHIPVIGINSGKLGFLANVAKEEIPEAIESLYFGKYTVEERSLLHLSSEEIIFPDFSYALNDMTIQKKDSRMITVHVYLNGQYLNTYWADGLIIATPTGSTAYSLSVGGPIVLPDTNNFIISPISPHNLTVRPIVVPDESEILLKPEGRGSKYLISMDHHSKIINKVMNITVKKAEFSMKVLQMDHTDFYTTLRNKLMWGIDTRNSFG
ncbi:MAG: NAD kinase [Bacteroidales bacterium]|nr:NAD kinase [Bacteroidales bacterium]